MYIHIDICEHTHILLFFCVVIYFPISVGYFFINKLFILLIITGALGYWWWQAEYLARKLDAYTSIPSTPSSMAALLLTEGCLVSGKASSLDAFRSYPKQLSCSACPVGQLINQRLRCPVPLVLGATSPQTTTPLSGRDRPVSRRSKPSSRSPLMGEQPHPWLLLQNQDGKSRHRGTKPRGRWELSPATSLLSLG
jgi:hypothetical protein